MITRFLNLTERQCSLSLINSRVRLALSETAASVGFAAGCNGSPSSGHSVLLRFPSHELVLLPESHLL